MAFLFYNFRRKMSQLLPMNLQIFWNETELGKIEKFRSWFNLEFCGIRLWKTKYIEKALNELNSFRAATKFRGSNRIPVLVYYQKQIATGFPG